MRNRLLRALTALTVALGVLGGPGLAAAGPAPGPDAPHRAGSRDVSHLIAVSLSRLEPRSLQADSTLLLAGTLVNRSGEMLSGLSVRLRRGSALTTRTSLAAADARPPGFGRTLPATPTVPTTLEPDQPGSFTYRVPVSELGLGALGIYPVRLEVRAGGGTLGSVDTFLPWFPDGIPQPLRLAWVVPITDRPHRGVPLAAGAPGPVLADDSLAAELAPGGRLADLLDAAGAAAAPNPPDRAVPVTWAVDPALLETVAAMATGYTVAAGTTAVPGTGAAAAAAWLQRLRALTARAPVVALPYADVDIEAVVRAGWPEDVGRARALGTCVAQAVLGTPILPGVVWPPAGLLSRNGLAALTTDRGPIRDSRCPTGSRPAPVTGLLLDGPALPVVDPPPYTVPARSTVSSPAGRIPALVGDAGLEALVTGPVGDLDVASTDPAGLAGSVRLAEQRFLAETALIAAEAPEVSRAVLITPPRGWDPSGALATAVLRDTGAVPWLTAATVPSLLAERPPASLPRGPLSYPPQAVATELDQDYLAMLRVPRQQLPTVAELLAAQGDIVRPLSDVLLRAESAGWRGGPPGAPVPLARALAARLSALLDGVQIITRGQITLTAASGVLPVTVDNALGVPVTVALRVDTRNRARIAPVAPRIIGAGRRETINLSVEARSSGKFPLYVSLVTPASGRPVTAPREIAVDVTAYGRLALAVTGGAFVVLLGAIGLRVIRRGVIRRGVVRRAGRAR